MQIFGWLRKREWPENRQTDKEKDRQTKTKADKKDKGNTQRQKDRVTIQLKDKLCHIFYIYAKPEPKFGHQRTPTNFDSKGHQAVPTTVPHSLEDIMYCCNRDH